MKPKSKFWVVWCIALYPYSVTAGFVSDGSAWEKLPTDLQNGYLMGYIDSYFYREDPTREDEEIFKMEIISCIEGKDTDFFRQLVDLGYKDVSNFGKPPWFVFKDSVRKMCLN